MALEGCLLANVDPASVADGMRQDSFVTLRLSRFCRALSEGVEMPADPGCYLEVVPHRKLVWTDALGPGYRPKDTGFFTP